MSRAASWQLASCVLPAAFAVGLWSATAHASGSGIARFGGEHGTVVATNPTALYYNPAGIAFSDGCQLFIDGQLALRSLSWTHAAGQGDVPEPMGFEGANYGTATAFDLFGGPMLGATLRLGDLTLGAAAYAPFGGSEHYDRNERFAGSQFPGAADGVARWHAFEASTMTIYGTLGAAYRFGPLSIGATGNLAFSSLEFARAQNPGAGGINDLAREGRTHLDVSGVHGSFGVGLMVEAMPSTLWFGASYQAQPGLGLMELQGELEIDPTVGTAGDSLVQKVTFHQALPDVFRVGARLRASSALELRVAGDMTRWSVFKTQCIAVQNMPCTVYPDGSPAAGSGVIVNLRRDWQNTFGVRGGASYWLVPSLEMFAGAGYETAAAPDATLDPVLTDADNLALALGGRLELVQTWFVALSYTHLLFFARDNTGRSQLADPAINPITRRPDGGGKYEQWVGVVNANLAKTF